MWFYVENIFVQIYAYMVTKVINNQIRVKHYAIGYPIDMYKVRRNFSSLLKIEDAFRVH